MSTTPSIFEQKLTYSVLGCSPPDISARESFAVAVLCSPGMRNRLELLDELVRLGAAEIILVETSNKIYELHEHLERLPQLRIIVPSQEASHGELVNCIMQEASCSLVLVIQDDIKVMSGPQPARLVERVRAEKLLCVGGIIQHPRGESYPSIFVPTLVGKRLQVLPGVVLQDVQETLYPAAFCGLYIREAFLEHGGYDPDIKSSFWQKAEFGLRASLWGYRVVASRFFRLSSSASLSPEDVSPTGGYRRCYLHTMAPRIKNAGIQLSWRQFFAFWRASGIGLIPALWEFSAARAWVVKNAARYQRDALALLTSDEEAP